MTGASSNILNLYLKTWKFPCFTGSFVEVTENNILIICMLNRKFLLECLCCGAYAFLQMKILKHRVFSSMQNYDYYNYAKYLKKCICFRQTRTWRIGSRQKLTGVPLFVITVDLSCMASSVKDLSVEVSFFTSFYEVFRLRFRLLKVATFWQFRWQQFFWYFSHWATVVVVLHRYRFSIWHLSLGRR